MRRVRDLQVKTPWPDIHTATQAFLQMLEQDGSYAEIAQDHFALKDLAQLNPSEFVAGLKLLMPSKSVYLITCSQCIAFLVPRKEQMISLVSGFARWARFEEWESF